LVLAMLTDTITAARQSRAVTEVCVITSDDTIARAACHAGARALFDPVPGGHPDPLNTALRYAEAILGHTDTDLAVIHGDLPALRSTELTDAITAATAHRRSFVTDRQGAGTTALFAFNAALLPSFGPDSAARHRASGTVPLAGRWPGLRTDVDTCADVIAAAHLGLGPLTRDTLRHTARPRCAEQQPTARVPSDEPVVLARPW